MQCRSATAYPQRNGRRGGPVRCRVFGDQPSRADAIMRRFASLQVGSLSALKLNDSDADRRRARERVYEALGRLGKKFGLREPVIDQSCGGHWLRLTRALSKGRLRWLRGVRKGLRSQPALASTIMTAGLRLAARRQISLLSRHTAVAGQYRQRRCPKDPGPSVFRSPVGDGAERASVLRAVSTG